MTLDKMQSPYDGVGTVFNIQRFSLDDGPGIRTTLFLKGCTLRCEWCHNPESIRADVELLTYPDRCMGCGACIAKCPVGARSMTREHTVGFDRSRCIGCGTCASVCLTDAMKLYGYRMTADEAVAALLRDLPFYHQSGGGVTFSGGEPMLQNGFVIQTAKRLKEHGIHCALDTAGNVPTQWYNDELLSNIDLFLYDVKAADSQLHEKLTGAGNKLIQANLRILSERGARLWIRIPFIPGMTCTQQEVRQIAEILKGLKGVERVELIPYHAYGESKYPALGRRCGTEGKVPSSEMIELVLAAFRDEGHNIVCDVEGGMK